MPDVLAPGIPAPTKLSLLTFQGFDSSLSVDYHIHSTYTDGTATIQENAEAAISRGIQDALFSDHVRHTSTYYPEFLREVRRLDYPGLNIHAGVETKILDTQGNLDCSLEIASMCDAILGSVHNPPPDEEGNPRRWQEMSDGEALELEFALAMAIVTKSRAHVIAHPMGMCVTRRNLKPLEQLRELAVACREHDKAFELNTRYCASPEEWVQIVRDAGCKVSFGSDAHKAEDVGSAWHLFQMGRRSQVKV